MSTIITDNEISLRPVELNDIDREYCGWYENLDGHLNFFSGSGKQFTKGVIIDDYLTGKKDNEWFYYIIECTSGERIGTVKVGPIDRKNKTSDLVCLIGNRNFLGKGIAPKVISIANKIAFKKHDIRRLHGGMHAQNTQSIKAYTRAGWIVEGILKGYYLVDGNAEDRVCVACFNPAYFNLENDDAV